MPPKAQHAKTKKSSSGSAKKRTKKKAKASPKSGAPKNPFLRFITWPFRVIFNATRTLRWWQKWPLRATLSAAVCGFTVLCIIAVIYGPRAYLYDMKDLSKMAARTEVFASDGKTALGRLHGDNRYMVKYDDVSPHLINALIAQEDKNFKKHFGVDILGTLKIPYHYLKHKKKLGASTITMQLARNSYPLGGRNVDRKLLEMAVAIRIEANYNKKEIMEHYMNRIFLGHAMYGVEAASRTYFEKTAKELTLGESAMIAGIIRGPNLYSPFVSLEKAKKQRDWVLKRMLEEKLVTQSEHDAAKSEEHYIRPKHRRYIQDSYAMDAIYRELQVILEKNKIKMGGLKVYTTLDHNLQAAAENALDKHLKKVERGSNYRHQTRAEWNAIPENRRKAPKYLQGAVVCIENKTGAILSIVGGRSAEESKYNRAMFAKPQVGSVVKPFVYLAAFEKGMKISDHVRDSQIRRGWPKNYDGKYHYSIPVTTALAQSRNCAAVHAGIYATDEKVTETLRQAGFENHEVKDKSMFLGSLGATPYEVASAYTIFPNGGYRFRPFLITHIKDQEGNIVYNTKKIVYQAASTGPSWNVSKALREVTTRGTARALQGSLNFREPCAGKTGTTDGSKDAWFAGYTTSISCAVWVGLDQPATIVPRGSGSSLALPIWADIMKTAYRLGYPTRVNGNNVQRAVPVTPRAVPVE